MENKALVLSTFLSLKKPVQDYICYEAWKAKGSIHGIHPDFGRHSYLQTVEIGDYYHTHNEDRINLVLQVQDVVTNI